MTIGLLGYGTVGKGFYDILAERDDMKVKTILGLFPYPGVEDICTTDMNDILNDPEIDTVVELIGGLHPAYEFVRDSLKAKKNVVTANKYLISRYYGSLVNLAKENGVSLRYSAAVGGGVPWLVSLERAHRISRVYEVSGILNGTTNFILDSMETEGSDFDETLTRAQQLGYAEADPSADIDALDAKRKIAISANVAFGVVIDDENVPTQGIRFVEKCDIEAAREKGYVCRLIGRARRFEEEVAVWVEPMFLPASSPEAAVHSCFNLITFDCRFAGRESFYGAGAGRLPTGYAVAQDCLDILTGQAGSYNWEMKPIVPKNELEKHAYYVRTSASSPELSAITVEKWGEGVKTSEVSVEKMHAIAGEILSRGEKIFIAGLN